MNTVELITKVAADRLAAQQQINRSTGKKAGERKSFSSQAVEAGMIDLSAACRADASLARKVRDEARQALNSGDVARYMDLRGKLPRAMAQAI